MPVKIDQYRDVPDDVRERIDSAQTYEAAVLDALGDADLPTTADDLAALVGLPRDSFDRALYRLRRKELVEEGEDGYDFASSDVEQLAAALVVPDEHRSNADT